MKRIRPYPFDALPRLARAQVEAGRALCGHLPLGPGRAWADATAALGGAVELRLDEAYVFPAREIGQRLGGSLLRLSGGAGRQALLVVDPTLAPRLARRALGVEGIELAAARPLTPPEQGALAFLVAALVDGSGWRLEGGAGAALPGADSGPVAVTTLPLSGADLRSIFPDAWVLALEAHVETPVGAGWARLLAAERLKLALGPPLPAARLAARRARLADGRVSLRLEVGRTRVARADLARIAAGDVVLFDRFGPRPPFGGPVVLRLGAGGFRARLGGDGLTIEKPFALGVAMADTPPPAPDEDATKDALLRELPVEVVCELGRVTMTGRDVLELRPGAIVPVGRPLAGPVDLTVGGRVVARGELVDVEGEIGIRILQTLD